MKIFVLFKIIAKCLILSYLSSGWSPSLSISTEKRNDGCMLLSSRDVSSSSLFRRHGNNSQVHMRQRVRNSQHSSSSLLYSVKTTATDHTFASQRLYRTGRSHLHSTIHLHCWSRSYPPRQPRRTIDKSRQTPCRTWSKRLAR